MSVLVASLGLVAAALLLTRDASRARRLTAMLGPRAGDVAPAASLRRRFVRRVLLCVGLLLSALALHRAPDVADDRVTAGGRDVVVCLDVSRSMLARDVTPSRLEAAQREIVALARAAHGDRVGLVAFAGEARLVVPLTRDVRTFADLAVQADPLSVPRGGTDLGEALDAARRALEARDGGEPTIVVLTDGEDLEQRGLRAAERCAAEGITVHCAAFGTARGSKIAVPDERGETFVRDRSGAEVVSAVDRESLARIAEATGGQLVEPSRLRALLPARALGGTDIDGGDAAIGWPLLAAFVLLLLEGAIVRRRR